MEKFNVSEWFANRASLNIQTFEVEGIGFELMALTDKQIEEVKECETYEEMLTIAADYGLSYNRSRVSDDEELAKDIDKLWSLGQLDINCDPCIKYRVGEKVCEISGLKQLLDDALEVEQLAELEKEEMVVDGDAHSQEDITKLINDRNNAA